MHNVDDLILNIGDTFKDLDDRLTKNYRLEFSAYSPSKLDKIWKAIQENHTVAKAPELGSILKYMALMGIERTKQDGRFYKRCTELKDMVDYNGNPQLDADGDKIMIHCNTRFSMKSKFCPKCNTERGYDKVHNKKPIFNNEEVVKCNVLPGDIRVLNELCAICVSYQNNSMIRGSKCSAWNTHDDDKKAGKNCIDCPCKDCCNEKPMNGIQHATFKIKRV